MSSTLSTTKIVLKFLLICISFYLFLPVSEVYAGAVINKAPTSLGLITGLVGYWSFDDPDMAENSSGIMTSYDRSGQGNHGSSTIGTTAPKKVAGRIGQGLDFDGVDDYVDSSYDDNLSAIDDISFSFWFKSNKSSYTADAEFFGNNAAVAGANFFVEIDGDGSICADDTIVFSVRDDDAVSGDISCSGFAINTDWHHVAAVFDVSDNLKIYVDGVLRNTTAVTVNSDGIKTLSGTPIYIGAMNDDVSLAVSQFFPGTIDEFRIYNRALSPDEIKRLYKIGATFKINTSINTGTLKDGLVGYWTFEDTDMAGVLAYDKSSSYATGTLTNGPTRAIGRVGQALDFDGVNDFVNISDPASGILDFGTQDFSISLWVRRLGSAVVNRRIVAKHNTAAIYSIAGYDLIWGANNAIVLRISDGGGVDGTDNAETLGTFALSENWDHVVGIVDRQNSRMEIYINGVHIVADGNTILGTVGNIDAIFSFTIGAANAGGQPGKESIDDVRVYNRILSPDEIKRLYKIGATFKINVPSNTGTLKDGLVGYWTFEDSDMAGVTAFDRSGQGNNATSTGVGVPVKAIGKIGQALRFDGNDDIVDAGSASSLDDLGPMTVSVWINPNSAGEGGFGEIIGKNGVFSAVGQWQINLIRSGSCHAFSSSYTNSIYFRKNNSGGGSGIFAIRCAANNTIEMGTWQHIAITWDGSINQNGITIYKNGKEVSSGDGTESGSIGSDAELDLFIGNNPDGDRTFDGLIDDVRIYNRALSPDEVKRLYNMGK